MAEIDREVAERMRAAGWSIGDISKTIGRSKTTVYRWLVPGAQEKGQDGSRAWKARNREHCRAYDREYGVSSKIPCPECGEPMYRQARMCQRCISESAEKRRETIIALYEAGRPLKEIAEQVGTSFNSLCVDVDRLRKAGRLGRRYPVVNGRRVSNAA